MKFTLAQLEEALATMPPDSWLAKSVERAYWRMRQARFEQAYRGYLERSLQGHLETPPPLPVDPSE